MLSYFSMISVALVARKAGLSRGFVYRVLKGQRGLSLNTAARIAKAAGVTLDELYHYLSSLGTFHGRHTIRNPDPGKLARHLVSKGYEITPMD